ncbi:E3 UFM1-protein ligase 1 homolog [Klebsormidium nitens]|uniref:E3 UFM1-protein ligase 1 homolog n=1 Tax=Klebsormidium nitens TaxID=105231 RepID=A0A1Y1I720_KLENI|nr:E3 UFM1-protein ligase 1 homolog [Klebsormidium nitens]|eukprot:GAQ86755.1 E3 UFM1-protein ligase 1 homolog [Klebsormidium nitens]
MDEELRKLQELFSQAQEVKSTVRLSERNVIELVNKLKQLGLLGDDLLHTVNGKEYITVNQLRKEMASEVHRQGRISLVDLATNLGVDLFHIERQADALVAEEADTSLVQGELLTTGYWDNLAEEIDESLQETGQVSIGELARQFNVGVELLTGAITARLDTKIHGKLDSGMLYTPAHVARIKAMVRGAMRGVTVPCSVPDVWASLHRLQQREDKESVAGVGGDSLYSTVLAELIAEGELKGTLSGGKTLWTPAVFSRSQRESVENFYSQNGHIAYDSLRKLAIPNPKQYLQDKYAEGIPLETVFVHPSLVGQLDAAVEEAVANGTWCEAEQLVPSSLSAADTAKLLAQCPSVEKATKTKSAVLVLDTCLVAESLLKDCIEKFDTLARTKAAAVLLAKKPSKAANAATAERNSQASTSAAGNDDSEDEGGRTKRGGKKGRRGAPSKSAEVDEEEEETRGGKGAKKGRRNKAGKGGAASTEPAAEENETRGAPTDTEMEDCLLEWYPDLEGAGAGTSDDSNKLARALVRRLRPTVLATFVAAKKAAFTAGAEERRKRRDALLQKLEEANLRLQLFAKALELFEEDAATGPLLQRHLLRTTATEATDALLMSEREAEAEDGEEREPTAGPLSAAERASAVRALPKGVAERARAMLAALDGKDVAAFQEALDHTAEACGVRLKKLDKKLERSLLHAHRKTLVAQLEAENSAVASLPLVVAALYAQVLSRALQAPGRAMAAAIARLKDELPPASFATLNEYHRATVDLLAATAASASEGDDTKLMGQKEESLNSQLASLKALVLGSSEGS